MATLTGEQLKDSYQSLVTIGDSITSNPTSGVLENGKGSPIDSVTIYNDATGVLDSSILNLSVLSNDANTNPRASIEAQKDGTNNGRLILNTSASGTLTERLRIRSGGDISFRDGSASEAFYWDASEARLGLGTQTPNHQLEIYGGSGAGSYNLFRGFAFNGTTNKRVEINIDNTESDPIAIWNTTRSGGATVEHSFQIDSSEKMRIDSSGNVGINNTSPSSFLSNGRELVLGDGSGSHGMTIFSDSSGTGNLFFADGTTGDEAYRGFLRYSHDTDSMEFYTAGANLQMTIDSSGNVGIGTDDPSSDLTVGSGGTSNPASTVAFHKSTADEYRLKLTSSTFNANGKWLGLGFGYSNDYLKTAIIAEAKDGFARSNLHFALNNSTTSSNASLSDSRMVIDYNGNVLVGTTTAYGNFTVYKKISMLSSGESSSIRGSYSVTNEVASVNNSTVDALRFLDPAGTVIGLSAISGIVSVSVTGGSGANQYLANYQILTPGDGTTGAVFTLIGSANTRGTSPVSSVQLASDGGSGSVKITITYINNAGVVDGGKSLIGFCGLIL